VTLSKNCARVSPHEIRVPRLLFLFFWFSEAAGGGRDALNLKFGKNPPKKAASESGGFFYAAMAGNPGAVPCRTTPMTFVFEKSRN
jgi:hypothetical protein